MAGITVTDLRIARTLDMPTRIARFNRFHATAGIDDAVRPNGKVRLVIRGDDNVLLETVVAGVDPPKPIDLKISGIRRRVILVYFADATNVGDHLLLCDARISK